MNQIGNVEAEPSVKLEDSGRTLSRNDFLNPIYRRTYESECVIEDRASGLAYMASSLVTCAQVAFEDGVNGSGGIPMQDRGIGQTIEIAASVIQDLIDECERLEGELKKARKALGQI